MKIRNGFVSNSSSSSFVVFFNKKPKSKDELKWLLFKDKKCLTTYYDATATTEELSETVFNDLQAQKKSLTRTKIIDELASGWLIEIDWDDFKTKDGKYDWPAYEKEKRRLASLYLDKYLKANALTLKDLWVAVFAYADEEGQGILEHGGIFDALEHIVISHH